MRIRIPKLLIKRLDESLQTQTAKSMGMTDKSDLLRHIIDEFLDEQEASDNIIHFINILSEFRRINCEY
jgi:hypothetical protein